MKYDLDKHVYFISYAKIPNNISAAIYSGHVGLGFVINHITGTIDDVSCTLLTQVARDFLKSIMTGYNLHENNVDELVARVKKIYHGHSQKALCVIIKENYKKYNEWKKQNE